MSKLLLVLSLVAVVAIVSSHAYNDEKQTQAQFIQWMRKHNKQYRSADETALRYNNFKATLERVNLKNKQSEGAVFGPTKFADMTPGEFENVILMKNKIPVNKTESRSANKVLPKKNIESLPKTFDWRDRGAVTAVKDQEQCGSCWAFSVTENIESQWILAGHATNTTLALAPQQLVDCDWTDLGCDGGNPTFAYDYIRRAPGLMSEEDYPYEGQYSGSCQFVASEAVAQIKTWEWATSWFNETELQQTLVTVGPLSICVDASVWQDYESGVLMGSDCAYPVNQLDHCVQLVGYDSTASTPYWIVRNSWNTDWGIEGYIWLQMGVDACGLADEATSALL